MDAGDINETINYRFSFYCVLQVGLRVEHPQELINSIQVGDALPFASVSID